MAGGPVYPLCPPFPAGTTVVFPTHYSNATGLQLLGVADATTMTADGTWRCQYQMPQSIPSGTLKLLLSGVTTGVGTLNVNPKWEVSSYGAIPNPTPTAEGTTGITFTTADIGEWKETKITLDAVTAPTAGQFLFLDLVFENTGSDHTALVGFAMPALIWE